MLHWHGIAKLENLSLHVILNVGTNKKHKNKYKPELKIELNNLRNHTQS